MSRNLALSGSEGVGVRASALQGRVVPAAGPGSAQGAACPTPRQLALQRAAKGGGGLAAAGCGGMGGYGCLGRWGGLLCVGLCGHPRQEEGAEACRGPWEDLPASSCCEEPGCGVAWLVLGYVPLLEDDLSLPGRQLCLIVPESP